ncbi:hypothetical protein AB1Y20_004205 [Prymnesium parvum]|uniref:SGNH hydrolase-type esterase domain-containing protein n=1 Tax=Prymnesium parvum TaxID=97485 RepID=A0AB34J788_PRYPA
MSPGGPAAAAGVPTVPCPAAEEARPEQYEKWVYDPVHCSSSLSSSSNSNHAPAALPGHSSSSTSSPSSPSSSSPSSSSPSPADAYLPLTCSPHGYRSPHATERPAASLCAKLLSSRPSAPPRRLLFVGDSFARHAYVGFALALSSDFRAGALRPSHAPQCEREGQFSEKLCRTQLRRSLSLCGGAVEAAYAGADVMPSYGAVHCFKRRSYGCLDGVPDGGANNFAVPRTADWARLDAVVWGVGRHAIKPGDSRRFAGLEPHDAAALEAHLLLDLCNASATARRRDVRRKLVWLDTLVRSAPPTRRGECPAAVRRFHEEMPRALRRACGVEPRVASVWDALVGLKHTEGSGWEEMTFDGVHWGMAANLLLAGELVDQISKAWESR